MPRWEGANCILPGRADDHEEARASDAQKFKRLLIGPVLKKHRSKKYALRALCLDGVRGVGLAVHFLNLSCTSIFHHVVAARVVACIPHLVILVIMLDPSLQSNSPELSSPNVAEKQVKLARFTVLQL